MKYDLNIGFRAFNRPLPVANFDIMHGISSLS